MASRAQSDALPLRDGLVPRPELVRRLADERGAAVAVIVAPAGYGKSTLLREWAADDARPFLWITLGDEEDDVGTLTASIARAIEEASPGRGGKGLVLVLDDAQAAPASLLNTVVMSTLGRLDGASQIAVASRTEPALPIARLRAHRRLVEVRTRDLAMTPPQAAELLRRAGLDLEPEGVQILATRTEGWPAGLYLTALSLREECDVGEALPGVDGSDHLIADYLREEFLEDLAPSLRSFLIRTSVLDELTGPACDQVLERTGSAGTLAELHRENHMLIPLDRGRQRFRWHGLFASMLRAELRRNEPELEPQLHARASSLLGRRGDLDGAIGHAVSAGDAVRAGDLMWANAASYLAQGRAELVERWLARLCPVVLAEHATLALTAAYSALIAGELDRARHWRTVAEAADRTSAALPTASLQAAIAIIDAAQPGIGAREMAAQAARAYDLEPEHSPWRPLSCLLRGVADQLRGENESAERYLEEGTRLSFAGAPSVVSLCLSQLAMLQVQRGEWDAAGELADRAMWFVQSPGLADSPISALTFAVAAATRAHRGRVDDAKRDLRHAVGLLTSLGEFIPWYGAEARIMLARAALGLADTVRARTLLADASRLARRTPEVVIFESWFDQAWAEIDTHAESTLSGASSLTIAELRILRFLPSHRSFKEIAARLNVSVNTVKTQAHAVYRKLDAASRSEAVAQASRAGLLGD